jgi:hypothetical protein
MARSMVRQAAIMANSDEGDVASDAVAFPSMGLPDPPSVEPIAVACASGEETVGITFPVDVAIEEPASEGKFPPEEEG